MSVKASEALPQIHRTMLDAAILDIYAREYPESIVAEVLKAGMGVLRNGVTPHKLPRVEVGLLADAEIEDSGPVQRRIGAKNKNLTPAQNRKFDVMLTPEWRKQILSFALSHEGLFEYGTFRAERYKPEEHGGVPFGRSRIHPVMAHMVTAWGWFTRMSPGRLRITDAGRKGAMELLTDSSPVDEPAAVKTPLPKKALRFDGTGDSMSAYEWKREVFSFTLDHNGVFDYKAFRSERYRPEDHNGVSFSRSRIHSMMSDFTLKKGWFKRLRLGHYTITKAGRQAAVQYLPESAAAAYA